ncbi:MAG TPA: CaiB/BaiF CoA-transferase family protein [Acidimicrobiia bacterium]|nr:CaiB/BaiF CoA-transferase family protein [Acidimicrobiia bacterium]
MDHDPPLTGIRVLELGSFVAGPFAGQLLADMGAEVIKVETPGEGDPMRRWGVLLDGRSIWWSTLARNKRLVALDLRDDDARALVRRLALTCDVVLENFAPGRLEQWGLGYDDLSAENPRLVMTRVSGFGQTGPRAGERGFGSIGEAMGGLRELTGSPDRPPARAAVSLGDQIAGLFAAFGTVVALRAAERDGVGQLVDVALYEAVFALMESLVADYELTGAVRTRTGGTLPGVAPSNAYPTGDGRSVMIAANADAIFTRLAEAMGQPELATDPRYATHVARGERMDELDDIVASWTRTLDFETIDATLERAAVPHGLIYRAPDMLEDPQYLARETIRRVHDAVLDRDVAMADVVPRLSRTPGRIRWAGADVGAHTAEVLAELLGSEAATMRPSRFTERNGGERPT